MGKGLSQEKFQVTAEPRKKRDHQWATFESQRRVISEDTRSYDTSEAKKRTVIGGINAAFSAPITNRMPPGQEIMDQKLAPSFNVRDGGLAGSTDESNSVNAAMLKKGFQHQNMRPEDEMYNNEHVELFYGEATVDGVTGFVERNNMLDRN